LTTVTDGTYSVVLSFDGIPLYSKSGALSSLPIPLPINPGPISINKTITLPSIPISGYVTVAVQITDSNNNDVICLSLTIPLSSPKKDGMIMNQQVIDKINKEQSSWTAGVNSNFIGMGLKQVKRLMGVKRNPDVHIKPLGHIYGADVIAALPLEYDPRTFSKKTSKCVGPVLDQAMCGSCWAFGAAEAISDRTCLKTGTYVALAPLDLVTCDQNDGGCEGGDPGNAWDYAQETGLVTEQCAPYLQSNGGPITTCPPATEPCLTFVDTPNCNMTCHNSANFTADKHFVSSVYTISGVDQIAAEIVAHGAVEAAFSVYSDFLTYKSGVYVQTSSDMLGGHAIKIIGYGTENGVDYWLCQNSWTTTWGDHGMFKIRKGTDECGIEDYIVAGTI
jgi:cathepsin B